MATRRFFDGAQVEIGSLPITGVATVVTQAWIKIAGVWKQATVWIKAGGVWKTATPKTKVAGTWK
jgi:hypothetical protein